MRKRHLLQHFVAVGLMGLSCYARADGGGGPPKQPSNLQRKPVIVDAALLVKQRQSDSDPWSQARSQGVARLQQLADKGGGARLGFDVGPSNGKLVPLDPFTEAIVQVEDIQNYIAGQNPAPLVRRLDSLVYPVVLNLEVRSSVTVSTVTDPATLVKTWKPVAYGPAPLILEAMRARLNTPRGMMFQGSLAEYSIISVTGLNLYFVGARGPRGLFLFPLFGAGRKDFPDGAPALASDVFLKLGARARAHVGGVPT